MKVLRNYVDFPHYIIYDLGSVQRFNGVVVFPRQDLEAGGVLQFRIYTSDNIEELTERISTSSNQGYDYEDEFDNYDYLPFSGRIYQSSKEINSRYVGFSSLSSTDEANTAISEFYLSYTTSQVIPFTRIFTSVPEGHVMPRRLDRSLWTVEANSYVTNIPTLSVESCIDDDTTTYWQSWTENSGGTDKNPSEPYLLTFDLQETVSFQAFSLLPRQDSNIGKILSYELYTGDDKSTVQSDRNSR